MRKARPTYKLIREYLEALGPRQIAGKTRRFDCPVGRALKGAGVEFPWRVITAEQMSMTVRAFIASVDTCEAKSITAARAMRLLNRAKRHPGRTLARYT